MKSSEFKKFISCGIYIITNLINKKVYIGQSNNIYRRWLSHYRNFNDNTKKEYKYPLSKAIRKYGIDNFDFSILELCDRNILTERESYYINLYNSHNSNFGYNQSFAYSNYIVKKSKLELNDINNIINLLKNNNINIKDIAKMYDVTPSNIYLINDGSIYGDVKITYPIRNLKKDNVICDYCSKDTGKKTGKFCNRDCYLSFVSSNNKDKYIDKNKKQRLKKIKNNKENKKCLRCDKLTYNDKFCSMKCKNIYENNLKSKIPSKEILIKLINNNNLTEIAKIYEVSANTVKKWLNKYGIEYKKKYPNLDDIINKSISFDTFKELSESFDIKVENLYYYCKKNNYPHNINDLRKLY